jgi:hypothetical protein
MCTLGVPLFLRVGPAQDELTGPIMRALHPEAPALPVGFLFGNNPGFER